MWKQMQSLTGDFTKIAVTVHSQVLENTVNKGTSMLLTQAIKPGSTNALYQMAHLQPYGTSLRMPMRSAGLYGIPFLILRLQKDTHKHP